MKKDKLILPKKRGCYKRKLTSKTYTACHKWLSRNFTKNTECEKCGSKKFIEWALKKGKKHSHNRKNYICLCSSCHKKYDYTLLRRKRLSASLKLVVHTKEWNRKVSESQIGKIVSEETRKKMSDYKKKHPPKRDKITGQYV